MARGRRDLAAIVSPVLLKPHASGRYLIAEGRFNTGALRAPTRIFGSLVAGARYCVGSRCVHIASWRCQTCIASAE